MNTRKSLSLLMQRNVVTSNKKSLYHVSQGHVFAYLRDEYAEEEDQIVRSASTLVKKEEKLPVSNLLYNTAQASWNVEYHTLLSSLFPRDQWHNCAQEYLHELQCIDDMLTGFQSQSYLLQFVNILEKNLPEYKLIPYLKNTTMLMGKIKQMLIIPTTEEMVACSEKVAPFLL